MRTQFIKELEKRAEVDDRIFLMCGDLGFSVLENFRAKFPERFLNVGIAEQNMAGMAAGLAKEGYKVFIYSIGNFPSLRALEQIRYDICYHDLDVTIVSVGAGFAYGPLGCSHHATEDLAVMRSLPNMTVYNPADSIEVTWAMEDIFTNSHASYLRLGKAGEPKLHGSDVKASSLTKVLDGKKALILSTGSISEEMKRLLLEEKLDVSLYTVFKFSSDVEKGLSALVKQDQLIVTIEENQLNGGFGSFILEQLNQAGLNCPVKRFGIQNRFIGYAGSQSYLRAEILESAGDFLKKL